MLGRHAPLAELVEGQITDGEEEIVYAVRVRHGARQPLEPALVLLDHLGVEQPP